MPSFILSCSCGKIAGAGRSGGIGIRARLKLVYPEGYEGSIPSFGIITRIFPLTGSSTRSCGTGASSIRSLTPGHLCAISARETASLWSRFYYLDNYMVNFCQFSSVSHSCFSPAILLQGRISGFAVDGIKLPPLYLYRSEVCICRA